MVVMSDTLKSRKARLEDLLNLSHEALWVSKDAWFIATRNLLERYPDTGAEIALYAERWARVAQAYMLSRDSGAEDQNLREIIERAAIESCFDDSIDFESRDLNDSPRGDVLTIAARLLSKNWRYGKNVEQWYVGRYGLFPA